MQLAVLLIWPCAAISANHVAKLLIIGAQPSKYKELLIDADRDQCGYGSNPILVILLCPMRETLRHFLCNAILATSSKF